MENKIQVIKKEISKKDIKNERMPEYLHKNLAAGKWFELTLMEQMGNIGSEVGRAREVFCSVFYGDNPYNVSFEELNRYFYEFAYAARLKK